MSININSLRIGDIIQQIKQYIKAHRDQKQQEFAAL